MVTLETSRGPIIIRPTRETDAEAYRELRIEALSNAPTSFGSDVASAEALTLEQWRERLTSIDTRLPLVAEVAGALVGTTVFRREEGAKVQHQAYVNGVYIKPAWRGLGILDAFFDLGLAWARSQQATIVKLSVTATNTPAIRTYTRLGFSVYGVEPDVLWWEGRYYDELLMYRRLPTDDR